MRLVASIGLLILTSSSIGLGISTTSMNDGRNLQPNEEPKNLFQSVLTDMDGDGVRELVRILPVKTKGVERLSIHDPKTKVENNRIEMDLAEHWGRGSFPTSIASGNIDTDSNMEIAITRKSSVNMRTALYDFESFDEKGGRSVGQMRLVQEFGKDWGRKYFAQQAVFGDLNGDGRDELILSTNAPDRLHNSDPNPKRPGPIMVYARIGTSKTFQLAYHVDGHFKGFKVKHIAIRDMNKDGKMDILVTEKVKQDPKKPKEARYKIFTPEQAFHVEGTSRLKLISKGRKEFANSFFVQKTETKIASADVK